MPATNPTFTLDDAGRLHPDAGYQHACTCGAIDWRRRFQHPGPVLCVNQGDTVTVSLRTRCPMPSRSCSPARKMCWPMARRRTAVRRHLAITSLTNSRAPGGSVTYSFVATNPGTFIYESGTESQEAGAMGLFGALIVRPTMGADMSTTGPTASSHPRKSSWPCFPRSIPISIRRWKRTSLQYEQLSPALLADQRRGFPDKHRR